ncbi:MAG: UvrD-helicase domain-containing protein [Erysipelotrichaceae bacterium]|nr:UvrD-helicase domain-containing protein [Erysipelotrichaceae bacterium]
MMNNTAVIQDKDQYARQQIINDIDENFFVEAGAGSGKTTALVNRMVRMVEEGRDISRICAITFTKAAAKEFYERFQALLTKRSNPMTADEKTDLPKSTEESRKRCEEALKDIDLCFMGTIDAFCGKILAEHPTEMGVPSDQRIITDAEQKSIFKQLYVDILAGKYETKLSNLAKEFSRVHKNPEETFVKGMELVMNRRNYGLVFSKRDSFCMKEEYGTDKSALINGFEILIRNKEKLQYVGNASSEKAWDNLEKALYAIKSDWDYSFPAVLKAIKDTKEIRLTYPIEDEKLEFKLSDIIDEHVTSRGQWYELITGQENGLCDQLSTIQYEISMTFFQECIGVTEKEMKEKGLLTFFDALYYFRNALKKDAESEGKLINYIYNRHSYFLIDEFQDTNPIQAEIFFYLSSENPVSNWKECNPRKGSMFVVGDPKQSIYRFRGADISSFKNVKELFENGVGQVLQLTRNFRSTKKLRNYFNRVFPNLLEEKEGLQSRYEEIPLADAKEDTEFTGIYSYEIYGKTLMAQPDYLEKTDSKRVTEIIKRLVNNSAYTILKKNESGETVPEKITYSDIMVITKNKKSLSPILEELKREGIPAKVEGKVLFESTEALVECSEIFNVLVNTSDSLSLFKVLTGKVYKHSKSDISVYLTKTGKKVLSLNETGKNPEAGTVEKTISDLIELRKKYVFNSCSSSILFEQIMNEIKIYNYVNAEKLEILFYALELLRNNEKSGIIVSLKDGADYLKGLVDGLSEEERCLSLDDTKDCVRMANLHKVKGLEAPVVILAQAYEKAKDPELSISQEGSELHVFCIKNEDDTRVSTNTINEDIKNWEKEVLKEETKRLVYVAATRAKNALIISKLKKQKSKKNPDQVSDDTYTWKPLIQIKNGNKEVPYGYDTDFFSNVSMNPQPEKPDIIKSESSELYKLADRENILKKNEAKKESTYEYKTPSKEKILSKHAGGDTDEVVEKDDTKSTVHKFPTVLGTMVHRLMEVLVVSGNMVNVKMAVREIVDEYAVPEINGYENDFISALYKVAETVRTGGYEQTNGTEKNVLNTLLTADEVYCEMPFSFKEDEDGTVTVWEGIIDVIYRKAGKWHIIDYKTNLDGTDLDEKYHNQLTEYVKAFKEITGEEADASIYHIQID